jgi:AraC family transcriptional regulator of adaptative response/methylated-DNA-[protein]-cysteine methyltransferase
VEKACRLIEQGENLPSLDALATAVGMSRYPFHRVFKASTGVTPKAYAVTQRVRDELARTDTVTEAIYSAGFQSNGRFYVL